MKNINGNDLYQMVRYGASVIDSKRELLNDINIFPVPDGDTGNNLVHTLQTIVRESQVGESFHQTLESISESALIGARGNSGMIFAQFINGLRLASAGKDLVTLKEFAEMANDSVMHTYESLDHPVEGTILTVIKTWAKCLIEIYPVSENVKTFFFKAYANANQALKDTTNQLDVLKSRNVVDSGAMGFILFLEGINMYYNDEVLKETHKETIEFKQDHSQDEVGLYRYCTEGLIKSDVKNEHDILKALKKDGDSLIVAIGQHMFRVHIHTNNPAIVFKKLATFGTIISQKVDDMMMDIDMYKDEHDTVIVTDSIGDIDPVYLLKHHVHVIPMNVVSDGVNYFDKLTLNNDVLFDLIETGHEYPTTATPSISTVKTLFDKLLKNYKHILVITVSSQLSATHQIIQQEIKSRKDEQTKFTLIDSMTNSAAQGLLIMHAVEMLQDNKPVELIEKTLNEEKKQSEILVCLETFKYATMSGRLPKAVGKIGMALGIRPIMAIDQNGKGTAFGFALSQKGITKRIIKHIKKDMEKQGIKRYALVHCLNQEMSDAYENTFTELIGFPPTYITDVSSATAIHSGKGTVAIAYIKNKE